jgi:hypothetical protein
MLLLFLLLAALSQAVGGEKEKIFSGPQPGEKMTKFEVTDLKGSGERRAIAADPKPTAVVFVHQVERSMVPLMLVIDAYATRKQSELTTEFVFLSDDPLAAQQRFPLVAKSLKLKSPISLSVDGPEGPGNYGLNKTCLLTLVFGKDQKAAANFALVQPGISDAPAVIAAMAALVGDSHPPKPEELIPERFASEKRMDPPRGRNPAEGSGDKPKAEIPGAAPKDPQLMGMLRRFIRPSNSPADVDEVLRQVNEHINGKPELKKQAIDAWTRVLFLKYGTEYARKSGQEFVGTLTKQ